MGKDGGEDFDWSKTICSTLKSSDVNEVKKLRKLVLLSLQLDESDKSAKKSFKNYCVNHHDLIDPDLEEYSTKTFTATAEFLETFPIYGI